MPLEIRKATAGYRYGVEAGEIGSPALIVLGASIEVTHADPIMGRFPSLLGWPALYIDLPAHGEDQRADEKDDHPLVVWRRRLDRGEGMFSPSSSTVGSWRHRCHQIINDAARLGLIQERVFTVGFSRGGFTALHAMASTPLIGGAALASPVPDLRVLTEFAGWEGDEPEPIPVSRIVGRPIYSEVGWQDTRVDTSRVVDLHARIVAAHGAQPARVSLAVRPTPGHYTAEDFPENAANWLRSLI